MLFADIDLKLGSDQVNVVEYLDGSIDKSVLNKIIDKSGISSLCLAKGCEDAVVLAKSLLSDHTRSNLSLCQLIVVVSESKIMRVPPLSSLILEEVDISNTFVLDIDSGCAGYVQALQIVENFFTNSSCRKAAIITVDTYSKFIQKSNRSVSPIFGDGASVNFFENNSRNSITSSRFGTFPSQYKSLICSSDTDMLNMNGAEIFIFVKSKVIPSISKTIKNANITIDDIDYFIIHQASSLVIEEIKNHLKIPDDKIFFEIQNTGNLVSTSIPYILYKKKKSIRNNSKILFSAFGVGLTFATMILDYENNYN